ncbi:hypothetical protein QYS49_33680 [Marivirga salinae]|uniref:Polysaccharide biosynthesis protein n=1 Tax=Marivirga salinarum TaxID=3059078 RepID=A0AA51NCB5_9BACT|nr:hypothetical protein [Marivirga sp. BDSF4-3]WMN12470.1 hypothetical protein QYS49_33680 [Marivirga sp. BDSF4-3]
MIFQKVLKQKYSLFAALIQPLKIFLIFKFIPFEQSGEFGWLFAIISIFAGFSHLGWGDSFAKSLIDGEGHERIAQHSITILNIFFIGIFLLLPFLLFQDYSLSLTITVLGSYFLLSIFRNNLKIIRSWGLTNDFFAFVFLRNLMDLIILTFIYYSFSKINIKIIFGVELITCFLFAAYLFRTSAIRRVIPTFDFKQIRKELITFYKFPLFLLINSLLSLVLLNIEKIVGKGVMFENQYNSFILLSTFINIAYSVLALLQNLYYKELLRSKIDAGRSIKKLSKQLLLILSFSAIPVFFVLDKLLTNFYSSYTYNTLDLLFIIIISSVIILNVFEMAVYYGKNNKQLAVMKTSYIVASLVLFAIFALFKIKLSLTEILIIILISKLLYFFGCLRLFNKAL